MAVALVARQASWTLLGARQLKVRKPAVSAAQRPRMKRARRPAWR
jgi:hypothetical protein